MNVCRVTAAAAALAALLTGLAVVPASAGTPFGRCVSGAQATVSSAELRLEGNSFGGLFFGGGPRQDPATPLIHQIRPGAAVRITVNPNDRVHYGGLFGWAGEWGPAGNGNTAPPDWVWPMPGGPQFAVVGQWNQVPDSTRNFAIRSDSGCLTVPAGIGNGDSIPFGMFVRTNDDYHNDNNGFYRVVVRVWQ